MARHKKGHGRRRGTVLTPKNLIMTVAAGVPLLAYARNSYFRYGIDHDALHAMTGVTMRGGIDKAVAAESAALLGSAYIAPRLINAVATKVVPAAGKKLLNAKLARI